MLEKIIVKNVLIIDQWKTCHSDACIERVYLVCLIRKKSLKTLIAIHLNLMASFLPFL